MVTFAGNFFCDISAFRCIARRADKNGISQVAIIDACTVLLN